jgi:hypothetical protein
MQNEVIILFTKDRPETLRTTIVSLQKTPYKKFVIDDSNNTLNQAAVSELCSQYNDYHYIGKMEFQRFVTQHNISCPKYSFILRELGDINWNLGYARNFALLFSKSASFDKVLFTDDDINVPDINLIQKLFHSLDSFKFAGANINGLIDDSLLGHIATDIGIVNERTLSGGFMAYKPSAIDHFFLNNYNEDWIWILLQMKNENLLQIGEVFQEIKDPFENYRDKVIFQEFGEIALEGVFSYHSEESFDKLISNTFWEQIIQSRKEYLNTLLEKAHLSGRSKSVEVINWVMTNSELFNAGLFQKLFSQYVIDRKLFLKLYYSL